MSRTFTHKTDESTLTTLCPRCLNAFRNTRGIRVRRADPYQLTKEPCTYCQPSDQAGRQPQAAPQGQSAKIQSAGQILFAGTWFVLDDSPFHVFVLSFSMVEGGQSAKSAVHL